MTNAKICGRFAPTPSGRIHLGNIFCSLLAWLHAKSQGGEIVLRIEDLDKVRCPRPNADLLAKDLEWLGLTWDNCQRGRNCEHIGTNGRLQHTTQRFAETIK